MKESERFIYKSTNLVNGKFYVGKHKIDSDSIDYYIGSGTYFQNAVKKYGKENFKREILEWCNDFKDMCQKERKWVLELNPTLDRNIGYNLVIPNEFNSGHKMTDEIKQKIGKALRGRRHTEEAKQNMSKGHKGKPLSEEHKQKISEGNKGKPHSEETKQKMRLNHKRPMLGKHHTNETKQKISVKMKGKHHTRESILKMRESQLGEKNSMYGKTPWNKGKKMSQKYCDKLSKIHTKIKINQEELYNLYIVKNKSRSELCEYYGCCLKTLKKNLSKYRILKVNKNERKV